MDKTSGLNSGDFCLQLEIVYLPFSVSNFFIPDSQLQNFFYNNSYVVMLIKHRKVVFIRAFCAGFPCHSFEIYLEWFKKKVETVKQFPLQSVSSWTRATYANETKLSEPFAMHNLAKNLNLSFCSRLIHKQITHSWNIFLFRHPFCGGKKIK